jgi:hypothetical protein
MSLLAASRMTILLAFKSLPLLLISFVGFLAIGLGNLGLFMLFIGHAIAVPIITELLHLGTGSTANMSTSNDIAQLVSLVPTTGASYTAPVNIMPSYWMAHISFFFGYLLMNAVSIYTQVADKTADKNMVTSRKSRAATIISSVVILLLVLSALRIYATGLETMGGVGLAIVVLGFAGVGWYKLAETWGARNSDIFGIASQMVTQESGNNTPMTCVYKSTPN